MCRPGCSTFLCYEPTYHSFAHHKDKSKLVRKAVDLASVVGQALRDQYIVQDLSTSNLPPNTEHEQPEQQV